MYITSPDPPKKTIEDYDFIFHDGMVIPISIDRVSGDTIDLTTYPHAIVIEIVEKPTLVDPTKTMGAEQVTIFTSHLLSIKKRFREVEEPTHEQKEQFRLTIQEMSKTVN